MTSGFTRPGSLDEPNYAERRLAQARESGDMQSVVILEKRLLGFHAVYGLFRRWVTAGPAFRVIRLV